MQSSLSSVSSSVQSFLAREHRLFIGGEWHGARSGQSFDVIDPSTGAVVSRVADAGPEDVDLAVAAARKAFQQGAWPRMTPADRAKVIWRLGELIDQHAEEFAQLETVDNGAPLGISRGVFVPTASEQLRYMAGWATKIVGEQVPVSLPGEWHAFTSREPVGVVGQIVPWNFPLVMAAWKIAPALAAGCTMVLKPSELTPLSALRLAELSLEAGIPPGVLNVVTGNGPASGSALASHEGVDKIAFTGSTAVGRKIVEAAIGNLKKVSLELGGKSPVIIFDDVDLDKAIAGAANAIFFNSGQVCVAGTRLYAHKRIYDKLMAGLAGAAQSIRVGPGLEPGTMMGPLVSQRQLDRVRSYVEAGQREGAELLVGGSRIGDRGFFMQPTVLAQTTPQMSVVREEIFGPVLCAMPFGDDDLERIAQEANNSPYGLAASIWSRDISVAHRLAKRLEAGTVWINTHNFVDAALPFGGFKQSGWGREMGFEAIQLYTEVRSVVAQL